jgi:hypothetical protein
MVLIGVFVFALAVSAAERQVQSGDPAPSAEQTEESVCLSCHTTDMVRPEYRKIPDEWRASWHAQHNVGCPDCHGGDSRDAAMAMSPQRGFVGVPSYRDVPEFCGKCHIGILKNFLDSGHGKALKSSGRGPNCVVCHGAHGVRKADINIINDKRCTQCHTYERAKIMKEALSKTEKRMSEIDDAIKRLRAAGVVTEEEDKELFRIQAEYRTLFHTIDVSLVKQQTDAFAGRLGKIDAKVRDVFRELRSRRHFSLFLMFLFAGMAVAAYLLARSYKKHP